jgi:hypothetical protein
VSVTIKGVTQNTTTGANGHFSLVFPTTTIPASATPYTIAYSYAGDSNLTPATNSATKLTVNLPPTITSAASTTFAVGASGSFTVTATGFPAPTFSESGTLPMGISFNSTTGVLSGTPAANTAGTYPITFTATNSAGTSAPQSFQLTITNNSALKISPSSVNFGRVYPFTIDLADVTLTNTGNTSIAITNINIASVPGGDSGDFFDLSLCPRTLAAGRSCIVGIILIPTGRYQVSLAATLVVTDSAAGSPQSVPLTATEINPEASLSSYELNFGTQKVKTTSGMKAITLSNPGNSPLSLGNLAINGDFAIAPGTTCTAGGTVAVSASCVINVTFTPTSKGTRAGTLRITDNALISPQVVFLSGMGD